MLLTVNSKTPLMTSPVPLLGVYLVTNMVLVFAAMVAGVIVSFVNDQPEDRSMPNCIRRVRMFSS